MMSALDAHLHFWRYSRRDFPWIDSRSSLARDYLPGDIRMAISEHRVDAGIAVQACHTEAETDWLLRLAQANDWIAGVVGWCDLRAPNLDEQLSRWQAESNLAGFRHIVQDEPDNDFIIDAAFVRGVRLIQSLGYSYDILVKDAQRHHVTRFLDLAGPGHFIIDHGAKPDVGGGQLEPWRTQMRAIARHPQVWCKISGLTTEANHGHWTEDQILPYLDALLEMFGPERLIYASDWPVCLLATSYSRHFSLIEGFVASRCPQNRDDIFGQNARRAYRLGSS